MAILGLGVSYRRASVELLERLAFVDDDYPKAYRRLADMDAVSEAVLLSTCNRVEVYAEVSSYHAGFLALKRFLSESRDVSPDDFAEPLYSHYEEGGADRGGNRGPRRAQVRDGTGRARRFLDRLGWHPDRTGRRPGSHVERRPCPRVAVAVPAESGRAP